MNGKDTRLRQRKNLEIPAVNGKGQDARILYELIGVNRSMSWRVRTSGDNLQFDEYTSLSMQKRFDIQTVVCSYSQQNLYSLTQTLF